MSDSINRFEELIHDISAAIYQISVALTSIMDSEDSLYHLHFDHEYKMAKKYIEDFEREEDPGLVEQLKGGEKIEENRKPLMREEQLIRICEFIEEQIMRDPTIMFSEAREAGESKIDLVSVIASLYEELHKVVTGQPYAYMFHWANKVGSWVEDDLFSEERFIEFLEELTKEKKTNE